jgi:gliding motility-associated-like protein
MGNKLDTLGINALFATLINSDFSIFSLSIYSLIPKKISNHSFKHLALIIIAFFLAEKSYAQCDSIKLSTNFKTNCQPALVQWVVKNAPLGSTFKWNYGSGVQQGLDTFYAYFKDAGKVSVSVQITFPNKTVCNITKTNFVEVFPKPIPSYYASRKKLCDGPDTVTYFDVTKNSAKRSWVIDGSNYNNANKVLLHSYVSAGIKKLSLVVEDSNGCQAIKEFDTAAIIHKDVILNFSADKTSGCVEKTVKFTPNINSNGLKILSYKWEFPGGQPFTQSKLNPDSIRFNFLGTFSPSLEIMAENGCIHKLVKENFVAFGVIESIRLDFSDTAVCLGGTISIKNKNNSLPGNFKWTLPGTTKVDKPDQNTCYAKYDILGKYDVSVVYDYNGCSVSKTFKNIIRVKGVKANYSSPDYYHCQLPHTVHLNNLSKQYEPGKMTYSWLIYSGSSKLIKSTTNTNDSFIVNSSGYYNVVLITKHSNGCTDTLRQQNFIRNYKILPDFDATYKVGCINQFIEFSQGTPPSSYKAPDKFKWTFYDKDGSKILGYSNQTSPKFSYPNTGLYSVKMIADNGIGCKDSITKLQFIEIVIPKINLSIANSIICSDEVLFGEGKSEPSKAKFSYEWLLTHQTDTTHTHYKTHTFEKNITKAGPYNLKFVHTINGGCRDSLIRKNMVKINGITAKMELDTFNGCVPLTVKPKISITENYHFKDSSNSVIYRWWTIPSTDVIIKNDSTDRPVFNFNKRGEYTIHLEVTNSDGCVNSIYSKTISVGVMADFKISDNIVCAGQNLILTNQSRLNPSKIKWLLDKDLITSDAYDKNEITIHYKNDATHKIGLIANKSDHCFDTIYRTIKSIVVKADMIALEQVLTCAPVYAQFQSRSKYADSLKWNFGDGSSVVTTDSKVGHIYRTNTGLFKGFNIQLIAKSNEGCSDTLLKINYIKVVGPAPSFEISNNEGCEPLSVKFKNTSADVFQHYLNFDDGTPLNSIFKNHVFTINNGATSQEYTPRMYAVDSLGCKAIFESPIKVIVKQNPKANFVISDSAICENGTIKLIALSLAITDSAFYLNKKGEYRTLLNSNEINIKNSGDYLLTQKVKNSNNCYDSLVRKIKVNPNPKTNFIIADTICQLKVINFINNSTADNLISDYSWELLNSNSTATYSTKNIKHVFLNYGDASVSLKLTDVNKCISSFTSNLTVPNPADVPSGDLKYVSVNFDSSININSKAINYSRFLSGNFYNLDKNELLKSITTKKEESFDVYKKNITNASACFDLRITDICGYESANNYKHCTIFLKVESTKAFTNQLIWTPYIGWPSIDKYSIYRKKEGANNYTLLANLPPSTLSYLDSGLCNLNYTYYVAAVYNELTSQSNSVTHFPKYVMPPTYKDIKNVSVIDNNTIEIKWLPSVNSNFNNYKLYRTNVQLGKQDIFYTNSNFYTDKDVETSSNNYVYHVSETDKCGNQSLPQYEGKSILNEVLSNDYHSLINWSTYKLWRSGVRKYHIQIEKDGVFKTINTVNEYDSIFNHDQTLENIHGAYCYRIMAVSKDENDTSLSNISCAISPSKLFFPNAFSPNGDGINDKIGVKSLFIYDNTNLSGRNFVLEIFNRYGEKVYLSHSIDCEWDGYYMGKPVQSGVYIFRIYATGVDNRRYSFKGTITILD